jgi:hypothetical protein
MADAPLIQLYIAVALQISQVALAVYIKPYDTPRGNRENISMTVLSSILMMAMGAFVIELKGNYLRKLAEQIFVYGFMGMMIFIIGIIIYDGVKSCRKNVRERREKKKQIKEQIGLGIKEAMVIKHLAPTHEDLQNKEEDIKVEELEDANSSNGRPEFQSVPDTNRPSFADK